MPTDKWLQHYASIQHQLISPVDLEAYFTQKTIGSIAVEVLDIGHVHFPTGHVFACDPLIELGQYDVAPFTQKVPMGTYPVQICVVPSDTYGDRYACVKVTLSTQKPVRYALAVTGQEKLDDWQAGDVFGFPVDAGLGCIADQATQEAFKAYWNAHLDEAPDDDTYNNLFCECLEKNAKAHPRFQRKRGDWLNWTIPNTDLNLVMFASGWGDGCYPVYFGFDGNDEVCAIYIHFIDIEADYAPDDPDDSQA